jgi:hypothetical protein
MYITLNIMGITQGYNKIGYDFENELKNLYPTPMREWELIPEYLSKYLSICLFVCSSVCPSVPMGITVGEQISKFWLVF